MKITHCCEFRHAKPMRHMSSVLSLVLSFGVARHLALSPEHAITQSANRIDLPANIMAGLLIEKTPPLYPPVAKARRISER